MCVVRVDQTGQYRGIGEIDGAWAVHPFERSRVLDTLNTVPSYMDNLILARLIRRAIDQPSCMDDCDFAGFGGLRETECHAGEQEKCVDEYAFHEATPEER